MSKPRFVLDTNLIVSAALLEGSVSRLAFESAFINGEVLISSEVQAELSEVLMRRKFDRYISEERRLRFLANFLSLTTVVQVTEQIHACRDPKDDKFLELAISGGASSIISGDNDLLILHPFRHISILTPAKFLETFEAR
jgi:putative PIN family toxin of toxin-antitoxin system